jgi:ADP-heptose:LPS heptosyltransferase
LQLAKTLLAKGYEPNFILTAKERNDWLEVVDAGAKIPEFISLSEVAAFIYESQYFIGNDSGIGHLASNLGIPTITIVLRKGVARQWRPSWSLGEIVLPPPWLITRPLKEKFWKKLISVAKVLRKFEILIKKDNERK